MLSINDEFMEAYKRVDKICKEMFDSDKGVSTYIDVMESNADGAWRVSGWRDVLKRLNNYRHIRNKYVHETDTSYSDICTPNDIAWLKRFYKMLLETTDPLAEYTKKTSNRSRIANVDSHLLKQEQKALDVQPIKEDKKISMRQAIGVAIGIGLTIAIVILALASLFIYKI